MQINVGYILGFHGLKGEVKVKATTDFENERFKVGSILYLVKDNDCKKVVVKSVRVHKNNFLLSFENMFNLNDVEKYKGYSLKINEEMLHKLDDDEFYFFELIGLEVFDYKNNFLGKVKSILETGANEVLVVDKDGKDVLIPFVDKFIKETNIEDNKIILDEVEGLW